MKFTTPIFLNRTVSRKFGSVAAILIKMESQSFDCKAQLLSGGQGPITDFCPPRPLSMLPSYHDRIRFEEAQKLVKKSGDYVLFVDPTNDHLVLCVRDHAGACHKIEIVNRQHGQFGIDGQLRHHWQTFPNVHQLVAFYEVYGLPLKDEKLTSGKYLRLDNAVLKGKQVEVPEEQRRPFVEPADLPHFHFKMSQLEAEMRLTKKGDFLIRQCPEKEADYIVSVRGENMFVHHSIHREPTTNTLYLLPRQHGYEPLESVYLVDEWIQMHVLYAKPVAGQLLMNPVPKSG